MVIQATHFVQVIRFRAGAPCVSFATVLRFSNGPDVPYLTFVDDPVFFQRRVEAVHWCRLTAPDAQPRVVGENQLYSAGPTITCSFGTLCVAIIDPRRHR